MGSDVIEGAMRVGAPLILPALSASPLVTVAGLAVATGASEGAAWMAKKAGLAPEYQRFAANVAALIAVGVAGRHVTKSVIKGVNKLDAKAAKIGEDVGGF